MINSDVIQTEVYFWRGNKGRLLCLERRPACAPVRAVLLISQPFGEEANKSRHMFALLAARLAEQGVVTVLPDMFGTGDSEGLLEDASFSLWAEDLLQFRNNLASKYAVPVNFLAVRFGALPVLANAEILSATEHLWLWNPVLSGKQFINQFFRTRLASEMFNGKSKRINMADIRSEVASNGSTEIAGYTVNRQWVAEVEAVDAARPMQTLATSKLKVKWLEISPKSKAELLPVTQKVVTEWQTAGINLSAQALEGEPFWATQEISTAPQAITALAQELSNASTF